MTRLGASAGRTRAAWMLLGVVLALGLVTAEASAKGGYLGVQMQDVDELLLEAFDLDGSESGVLVTEVMDGSPAEAAGLRRGDLIVELDGEPVADGASFTRRIRRMDAGDTVEIAYLRRGDRETAEIELGARETRRTRDRSLWIDRDHDPDLDVRVFSNQGYLGIRVEPLGEDLGRYFQTDSGLLVLEVFEGTGAEEAGMRTGDVILEVDGEEVAEMTDIFDAMEDADEGDTVDVVVLRDGNRETLEVEVEENQIFSRHFNQLPRMLRHHGLDEDGSRFFFSPDRGRVRTRMLDPDRGDLEKRMEELQERMEALQEELEDLRGDG